MLFRRVLSTSLRDRCAPVDGVFASLATALVVSTVAAQPIDFAAIAAHPTMQAGLQAWRTADAVGDACVNCHTPDAFDLAYIDFSDENIKRRALGHVDELKADQIVAMVHFIREQYNITELKDPRTFRPFQPGSGQPLPADGDTPADWDYAFLKHMHAIDFVALRDDNPVVNVVQGRNTFEELASIDPKTVDIALPLNRWSQDGFHTRNFGGQSGQIADWMTEMGNTPENPLDIQALYDAHDIYLADPTWENFWYYYDINKEVANIKSSHEGVVGLSKQKYRSAQLAAHMFRREVLGLGTFFDEPTFAFSDQPIFADFRGFNGRDGRRSVEAPIWAAADASRAHDSNAPWPYPQFVFQNLRPDWDWEQHLESFRLPWFYAGWLFHPTLERTTNRGSSTTAEYFMAFGLRDMNYDLPAHLGFAMSIHNAHQARALNLHSSKARENTRYHWNPGLGNFQNFMPAAYVPGQRVDSPPERDDSNIINFINDEHEQLYVTFIANLWRSQLFEYREYIREKGPSAFSRYLMLERNRFRQLVSFMDKAQPENKALHRKLTDELQLLSDVRTGVLPSHVRLTQGDFNVDGQLDFFDVAILGNNAGEPTDLADADLDGMVGCNDLAYFVPGHQLTDCPDR